MLRASTDSRLGSADSRLQLDLEDRAKRCLSEDPVPGVFSPAWDKLKLSDDEIEEAFTRSSTVVELIHPFCNSLDNLRSRVVDPSSTTLQMIIAADHAKFAFTMRLTDVIQARFDRVVSVRSGKKANTPASSENTQP